MSGTTLLMLATDAFQAYQKATGATMDSQVSGVFPSRTCNIWPKSTARPGSWPSPRVNSIISRAFSLRSATLVPSVADYTSAWLIIRINRQHLSSLRMLKFGRELWTAPSAVIVAKFTLLLLIWGATAGPGWTLLVCCPYPRDLTYCRADVSIRCIRWFRLLAALLQRVRHRQQSARSRNYPVYVRYD
jgi:hypothetical protein